MTNYVEYMIDNVQGTYKTTETYWAVRPSPDKDYKWDEETKDWAEKKRSWDSEGPFLLLGGQAVYIYDKRDLVGLRGLLDAIEKELDE